MGQGKKRNAKRRARHRQLADSLSAEIGIDVPVARGWLQFHGFFVPDASRRFRELAALLGQELARRVVEILLRDKAFSPYEYDDPPVAEHQQTEAAP